jgi:hypothetical protein
MPQAADHVAVWPRTSNSKLGLMVEEAPMAHRSIADELVNILAKAGVQRIYGIVGDSLNPVTDAVRQSGKIQG